jgi:FAD-linked sulfhydryl oxidase
MAKMANETIRAELGRSAWKVFHTILAQYPEKPTVEEKDTLKSYIHLFSRVYPCRECAEHFQVLLKQYPPQLSSREVASQWGCHVHNQVNDRLGKPLFDCMDISDKYECGCAEDEEEEDNQSPKITMERQDPETGG